MKSAGTVLCLMMFLAGCAGSPDAEPVARLRVTQHQLACCYMEGQMSYVQVINAGNEVVADVEFRALDMIQPALDEILPAGSYTLRSWQRPCAGNCGSLDPPRNLCETALELAPGTETFITSAFTPGMDCSHTETAEPLQSPVPDRFALREVLKPCGEEFPIMPFLGIQDRSPARTCFLESWTRGELAEMSAYEQVSDQQLRQVVYRILPDTSIEVFMPPENPQGGSTWTRYRCLRLEDVNDFRIFTLDACSESEAIN